VFHPSGDGLSVPDGGSENRDRPRLAGSIHDALSHATLQFIVRNRLVCLFILKAQELPNVVWWRRIRRNICDKCSLNFLLFVDEQLRYDGRSRVVVFGGLDAIRLTENRNEVFRIIPCSRLCR